MEWHRQHQHLFIHCLGTDNVDIASATPCRWSGVEDARLLAHCCGSNTLGHVHATPSLLRAIDNAAVAPPMPWQQQCFSTRFQIICMEQRTYKTKFVSAMAASAKHTFECICKSMWTAWRKQVHSCVFPHPFSSSICRDLYDTSIRRSGIRNATMLSAICLVSSNVVDSYATPSRSSGRCRTNICSAIIVSAQVKGCERPRHAFQMELHRQHQQLFVSFMATIMMEAPMQCHPNGVP